MANEKFSIKFPTKGMCAIWNNELVGQFSDGYWENSRANLGYSRSKSAAWWNTIAISSGIENLPYFPCPYSLKSFAKTLSSDVKSGEYWPYRMIGYYYNAEKFGNKIDVRDIEDLVIFAATGDESLTYHFDYNSLSSTEKSFLEFLETLDFKSEWKKIVKVLMLMQKTLKDYYL